MTKAVIAVYPPEGEGVGWPNPHNYPHPPRLYIFVKKSPDSERATTVHHLPYYIITRESLSDSLSDSANGTGGGVIEAVVVSLPGAVCPFVVS